MGGYGGDEVADGRYVGYLLVRVREKGICLVLWCNGAGCNWVGARVVYF